MIGRTSKITIVRDELLKGLQGMIDANGDSQLT